MKSGHRLLDHVGVGALAIVLMSLAVPARAMPITWTLENVTFGECRSWGGSAPSAEFPCTPGGTATGSFVFDAVTATVSAWNISVAGGDTTVFPAFTWSSSNSDNSAWLASPGGDPMLVFSSGLSPDWLFPRQIRLVTDSVLPDAYGTVQLLIGGLYGVECYNCVPYRFIASGQLTSSPPVSTVPEPAAVLLLGTGLVGAVRAVRSLRR